jgi:hypothetical protein
MIAQVSPSNASAAQTGLKMRLYTVSKLDATDVIMDLARRDRAVHWGMREFGMLSERPVPVITRIFLKHSGKRNIEA